MERLIENDGYVQFIIEYDGIRHETQIGFTVHEVVSWNPKTKEPVDFIPYVNGSIKWDGCSTVNFSDHLHLCGKRAFEKHKQVMDVIWNVCTSKIECFNAKEAE